MTNDFVVIVAGGGSPSLAAAAAVPDGATVIAVDGGVEHARELGLDIAVLVGDLDSAQPTGVQRAERAGARIARHPVEKDATDLELGLEAALELAPARVLVLASDGGRLDHLLSSLLLLGSHRFRALEIDAYLGATRVSVVRGERTLEGEPGELVSLFALHGPAEGVRTEGLVYPLAGETLEPGSSRGVSNVFSAPTARISMERGVLLAVRPGRDDEGAAE